MPTQVSQKFQYLRTRRNLNYYTVNTLYFKNEKIAEMLSELPKTTMLSPHVPTLSVIYNSLIVMIITLQVYNIWKFTKSFHPHDLTIILSYLEGKCYFHFITQRSDGHRCYFQHNKNAIISIENNIEVWSLLNSAIHSHYIELSSPNWLWQFSELQTEGLLNEKPIQDHAVWNCWEQCYVSFRCTAEIHLAIYMYIRIYILLLWKTNTTLLINHVLNRK